MCVKCEIWDHSLKSYFFASLFQFCCWKFSYWNDVSWYNWNYLGKRIVLDVPNSLNLLRPGCEIVFPTAVPDPPSDYHHSGIFSDGIHARVRTGVRNCSGINNLASGIWTRPQYERVVGIIIIQRECFNQALYCMLVSRLY